MTQDEIIEMAEQAGFDCYGEHITWDDVICTNELKAFAKLVADKAIAELESQEPLAWLVEFENGEQELHFDKQSVGETQTPLYTTPPQRTEQEPVGDEIASIIACRDMLDAQPVPPRSTEQNFCPRCGKRTKDLTTIHTCTPPQD